LYSKNALVHCVKEYLNIGLDSGYIAPYRGVGSPNLYPTDLKLKLL